MWLVAEEISEIFLPPTRPLGSLSFCRGDVFGVKLDGNIAASSLDKDGDLFLILRDRLDSTGVAVKQPAVYLYLVTDGKHEFHFLFVNAERLDLRIKQRSGS